MLYVHVSCFVVHGCAVSRTYIHVCNGDMFSVVNVYLDHLKFCVVYIDGQRYVCCSECNVVSNECDQGSHRNLIMNCHDFSMTICHFSMTFDHQLNSFATMAF